MTAEDARPRSRRAYCSCYVDLANLREYVGKHAAPAGVYAGFIGAHDGVPFASGSGYFLTGAAAASAGGADPLEAGPRGA